MPVMPAQTVATSQQERPRHSLGDLPWFDNDKVSRYRFEPSFVWEDQPSAHLDVRDIFGKNMPSGQGTAGTVAAKTALADLSKVRGIMASTTEMQRWERSGPWSRWGQRTTVSTQEPVSINYGGRSLTSPGPAADDERMADHPL